jgi:hypothetical protein
MKHPEGFSSRIPSTFIDLETKNAELLMTISPESTGFFHSLDFDIDLAIYAIIPGVLQDSAFFGMKNGGGGRVILCSRIIRLVFHNQQNMITGKVNERKGFPDCGDYFLPCST